VYLVEVLQKACEARFDQVYIYESDGCIRVYNHGSEGPCARVLHKEGQIAKRLCSCGKYHSIKLLSKKRVVPAVAATVTAAPVAAAA